MARMLALALLLAAHALAQSPCPQAPGCSDRVLAFSGRVVDAADGRPIAGATVHYRGDGNASITATRQVTNPISLQGEVETGADGAYTLPKLPDGNYTVRVSAPGYFAERKNFYTTPPLPAAVASRPAPTGMCMRILGKPDCTQADIFHGPDTNFQLQADRSGLKTMSDAALAKFAPPTLNFSQRDYVAAAFAPGGSRVGFITLDRTMVSERSVKLRCVAWTYDLQSGALAEADLPGSPLLLTGPNLVTPPDFCSGADPGAFSSYHSMWVGDDFYVFRLKRGNSPAFTLIGPQASVMRGGALSAVSFDKLPQVIQTRIANKIEAGPNAGGGDSDVTADGRFKAEFTYPEDGGWCGTLEVTTLETKKKQDLASGCVGSEGVEFLLDRERDGLLYTVPPDPRAQNHFEELIAIDLKTGIQRSLRIPIMNQGPKFIAEQNLQDGAVRVAYTMHGDCDPAASDYSQPGQPSGKLGQTPNQFSVCFITIPPSTSSSARTVKASR